ncbi:DEAD/DEAH box helicase [Rickettsiales endosymbiont of Stachyamoeba lipophora]|nr:DEAD/DEAH box helicase [Rickettsiales endosymbiont of Stachyamoeba lipophora]
MNFTTPTPIQSEAIPVALEGKDILGSAQTGTGKTGAFAIPLVARMLGNERETALVLTPTRELAVQVMSTIQLLLGRSSSIKTALLIGGEPMPKQFQQLKGNPRVIVGTPGRINDHLRRGSVKLNNTKFLVLDETDRMLDMGFGIQLEDIAQHLPTERQTLMFSATLPHNIVRLSDKYLNNPVRIAIGSTTLPSAQIKQEIIHTTEGNKYDQLLDQLEQREGSIIIFVKTKRGAEKLTEKLCDEGYDADTIHGDLRQGKREKVLRGFHNKKYRILIATDIAARGLDVPHIEHVINYDLPQCPEDYIHRIGRTGRAGAEGSALCLITPADRGKWRDIDRLMNPNQKQEPYKSERSGDRSGDRRSDRKDDRRWERRGDRNDRGADRTAGSGRGDRTDRGSDRTAGADRGDRGDRTDRRFDNQPRDKKEGFKPFRFKRQNNNNNKPTRTKTA